MVSYYDTACFAINKTQIIKGQLELKTYWMGIMSLPGFQLTWETKGVDISGNWGFKYGQWKRRCLKDSAMVERE